MKYIKNLNKNLGLQEFNNSFNLENLLVRKSIDYDKCIDIVKKIESQVFKEGDLALQKLTNKFDAVKIDNFLVTDDEINNSISKVSADLKKSIKIAFKNISKFHKRQIKEDLTPEETSKGVYCWQEFRAINSVGLYIPGGTAPLFSTVLMLGVPAKIAGCKEIIICTPPNKDGLIAPEILYAANLIGIKKIYKVGGAQAIFAMGYGTNQIKKVDKIFGPGNSFVTAAKLLISQKVAIDMPAGPSEVLLIADEYSNPKFIASDLLSQAEHGVDSQVVLICNSSDIIKATLEELDIQKRDLFRKDIIDKALENSFLILTSDIDKAIEISNKYAPEHLILQVEKPSLYINKIMNAGSVFCGKYSPESAGDYISGPNHTLPTSGFAKSFSGVGVESFGKWITFQKLTKQGITNIGNYIEIMADAEGLQAHKNAITIRLNNL